MSDNSGEMCVRKVKNVASYRELLGKLDTLSPEGSTYTILTGGSGLWRQEETDGWAM